VQEKENKDPPQQKTLYKINEYSVKKEMLFDPDGNRRGSSFLLAE
jgi:hypothetical protein